MAFVVKMTRSTAALYLAKEVGSQRASKILSTGLVEVSPHFYRVPTIESMFQKGGRRSLRKSDAAEMVVRVQTAVAYENGRLGNEWHCGDVCLERA